MRARNPQWDPAVALFEEVAIDASAGELAPYAANLALEALNLRLISRDGEARQDCLLRFQTLLASFEERFCGPTIDERGALRGARPDWTADRRATLAGSIG